MWAPRLQLTEGRPPPPTGPGPIDFSKWPEAEAKWAQEFEGQLQIEKQRLKGIADPFARYDAIMAVALR
eukprot:1305289-Rhodomonas_salina.1